MSSDRALPALDRAALLLQLVPYIIGKGEVSIAEAAADFDVTADQMRAMVERLTVIGLPGEGGYWQLPNELFDIDWDLLDRDDVISITNTVGLERSPRLTAREAAALLAGLQLTRTLPGVGDSALFTGLLAKLRRGASSTPPAVIVAPGPVDGVRDVVDRALRRGVAVSFTYRAPGAEPTIRTVDPIKVHIAGGQWYLQGWCHTREAVRTFHLERVGDPELTDIPAVHGADPVPELFAPSDDEVVARFRFPRAVAPLLSDYLERATIEGEGEVAVASLRLADEQSLKRLAARRGGEVELLEPTGARTAAAAWAAAGLAQYRGDVSPEG
ncbi:MAG: WYL domain-containing protein [Microbacterium sp. 71-36]|uniref:helix-turn-helix transcriptional regulator n=1 Tax=unclassified Microbacterium TaxID=2609290 RepID=UPI00086C65F2|nr:MULTISPECIES: WYL domain-containing protein [unclassified Microbacterium]MBN9210995.1 WYL domain-containing protein [Microbacterium sp.]ODT37580.1 MAG: WYL domain-containing protein [Microbacterium sp. SCN 71-17]OJV76862.1 MAG: WYL domain-containing protein [Microbacterium sp. 71-36]